MEVLMVSAVSVKSRRAELRLTQQEAARRADVSLATWRRLENTVTDATGLEGFRPENIKGFARALKLTVEELRRLVAGDDGAATGGSDPFGLSDTVRLFNKSFTGDPLTPADAMALSDTVVFSDFAPTVDGRIHLESGIPYGLASYLKGEATIRDVELLCDLPELALTQVSDHWLVRMGERIMRVGSELHQGRTPQPVCLADEYALLLVIRNTEPPQIGDVHDMYPGLLDAEAVFGYDPDFDDLEEDEGEGRIEWMDRMIGGLLPPDSSHDFRRYDLMILETFGQGVYDPSDPRHPLRWFDRDDLRDRCQSELEFVRLSEEEQDARTRKALERMSKLIAPGPSDEGDQ
ncbi:hypothetical protein GCM10027447_36280 [Glycomyces halotolerans]